jgi:predicted GNAT family acetyltransferase
MRVERCGSAAQFLEATAQYRSGEPLRTNVLGSVATTVADGSARYDECFWWVVRGTGDEVAGAAMRTVPQALALGPMDPLAAGALAPAVAEVDDQLPAVTAGAETLAAFLDAYRAVGTPGGARVVSAQEAHVLYVIEAVSLPDVAGELVRASFEDAALAARWYAAFDEEVDGLRPPRADDDEHAAVRHVLDSGRLRWWRRDDDLVSMAAHSVPIDQASGVVTRIGPVYTPPDERRRGYAGAVTGALAVELLARGSRVILFADAANPTSNHVYQDLGFTRVDEIVRAFLGEARPQ